MRRGGGGALLLWPHRRRRRGRGRTAPALAPGGVAAAGAPRAAAAAVRRRPRRLLAPGPTRGGRRRDSRRAAPPRRAAARTRRLGDCWCDAAGGGAGGGRTPRAAPAAPVAVRAPPALGGWGRRARARIADRHARIVFADARPLVSAGHATDLHACAAAERALPAPARARRGLGPGGAERRVAGAYRRRPADCLWRRGGGGRAARATRAKGRLVARRAAERLGRLLVPHALVGGVAVRRHRQRRRAHRALQPRRRRVRRPPARLWRLVGRR
mmetsp:Transcript_10738/g.35141  ORF Transcript_10738/g.35141 Transcript_10738/m.35141 type:complete len:271 (-) Transcript_10738:629-1441(-)